MLLQPLEIVKQTSGSMGRQPIVAGASSSSVWSVGFAFGGLWLWVHGFRSRVSVAFNFLTGICLSMAGTKSSKQQDEGRKRGSRHQR